MPKRSCSVDGCDRSRFAAGQCWPHLRKHRLKTGDLCRVQDCPVVRFSGEFCSTHYKRARGHVRQLPCERCGELRWADPLAGKRLCAYCARVDNAALGVQPRIALQKRRAREARALVGPIRFDSLRQFDYAPRRRFIEGACVQCGNRFVVETFGVAKYCSDSCRWKATDKDYWISDRERATIYERDGWRCQWDQCPRPDELIDPAASGKWAASLDHIECRSWVLFPDHSSENLRLMHRWCNSKRGDEMWLEAC